MSALAPPFPRIVFVGVHTEAEAPLRWILDGGGNVAGLVTLLPEARTTVSGAVDLAPLAARAGVEVLQVRKVNDPECLSWIAAREPDLLLVVGWTQLLHEPLLRVPKIAALGFHASLLPKYRGRAPINWALIHGEKETGNTMIVLEPGADEGDIVAQRRIPIADADDCATLYAKVAATEVEMLAEILPVVRSGRLPRRPQDPTRATVMPKRRPEDGEIDWSLPSRRIFDWVRALTHPYPGAFTHLGRRRLFVWRVEACGPSGMAQDAPPGTVAQGGDGYPVVATGDGAVRLLRVQFDGASEIEGRAAAAEGVVPGAVLGARPAETKR